MIKYILLVFYIVFSLQIRGQENATQDKVILKTGEVFVGKIILRTNEMVMLSTASGMRYQFVMSEIKKVESHQSVGVTIPDSLTESKPITQGNFAAIADISAGLATAKQAFTGSPATQFSLVVGNKSVFNKRFFVGAGLGYSVVFSNKSINTTFVPLFIRLQSTLTDNHSAPYVGIDAGYAFALNEGNKGGEMVRIYFGLAHKISYKSVLYFGIYAGIQGYKTQLIEKNSLGTFSYFGSTTMDNLGCKLSLQF